MNFKQAVFALLASFSLSATSFGQNLNDFQRYAVKLRASSENVAEGRSLLEKYPVYDASYERELSDTNQKILLASVSIGHWILPGISSSDALARLTAFCEYVYAAKLNWVHLDRLLPEAHKKNPEWQNLFHKAQSDLTVSCDY